MLRFSIIINVIYVFLFFEIFLFEIKREFYNSLRRKNVNGIRKYFEK